MDVNKAYSDSLDAELFTVHLMFEEPVPDNLLPETSPQKGVFGRSNFVLPTYTSPSRRGGLAFEIGLDEVRNRIVSLLNKMDITFNILKAL